MAFPRLLQNIRLSNISIPLFVPDAETVKEAHQKGEIAFPYWSRVWPAAKALAKFILDNPAYTDGKRVLEMGAGLGLPSLVAARNATSVVCTDSEAEAVAIAKQSAEHGKLKNFRAEVLNWQCTSILPGADVLLLSDVSYAPASFSSLIKTTEAFLQTGTTVLLSTPQRLAARDFAAPLLQYCMHQDEIAVMHESKEITISVMVLQKR